MGVPFTNWMRNFGPSFRREDEQPNRGTGTEKPFAMERTKRMFASITDLQHDQGAEPNGFGSASQIWKYLVEEYTRLSLTRETNRLPALSGVAAVFAKHKDFQQSCYLAGIWSNNFPEALYWPSQPNSRRPLGYRAPSFSWAAVEGPVDYHKSPKHRNGRLDTSWVAAMKSFECVPKGVDPHGQVIGGYIDIEAWTGQAIIADIKYDKPTRCILEQT